MVIHATPQHDRPRPSTKSLRVVSSFRAAESLAYMPEGLRVPSASQYFVSVLSNSKVLPKDATVNLVASTTVFAFVRVLFILVVGLGKRLEKIVLVACWR